jgi:hypothetical protein
MLELIALTVLAVVQLAADRGFNVHRIVLNRFGTQLDPSSRLTTDYDFFEMLRTNGKRGGAFSTSLLRISA